MAVVVKLTDVSFGANGEVYITFADGTQYERSSMDAVRSWLDSAETQELAHKLCVSYAAQHSPELTDISAVKDRNFSVDIGSAYTIQQDL